MRKNSDISIPRFVNETLHKKSSFPLRISSVNVTKKEKADLVALTREIFNEKLNFCAVKLKLASS